MTTPNQPLPTTLETLLGVGAFQIGGGGTTFGQDIDEDFVDTLVKLPYATLDNMIDILQMALLRLPIEALQAFSSIVPDWLEEPITDVAEAVDKIIDALQARDIPMLVSVFEQFVEDMLDSLGIPVLGDLVDKMFDLTDGFDTLFGGFDILDGGILNQIVSALTGSGGGLPDITDWVADIPILSDIVDALTGAPGDITDLDSFFSSLLGIIGGTAPTGSGVLGDIFDRLQFLGTGGTFDAAALGNIANIPALAQSSITGLPTLAGNVTAGFQNIYNTWFGGTSATGTAAELALTVGSIQDSIYGDFTVTTFTSSNSAWTIPSGVTQMIGGCIGGGGKGGNGQTGTSGVTRYLGGAGGSSGGIVIGNPLDLTGLTPGTSTLNITVGAAATSANTDGGVSSIVGGSISLASEPGANAEIRQVSIYPTAALPCAGGRGGDVQDDIALASAGTDGTSNGLSTGGAGGAGGLNANGTNGSSGQDGEYSAAPKYGGAGGGGGGAGRLQAVANVTGGNGGAGGFPGGGGGGGGAARNDPSPGGQIAGAAGNPAAGLVWLMYK